MVSGMKKNASFKAASRAIQFNPPFVLIVEPCARRRGGSCRRLEAIGKGCVMRRFLPVVVVGLVMCSSAHARGILIPKEKDVPPLAMLNHQVNITIEDQVAVTNIEQTFRNHTDRKLEATYVFPVPKGASVRKFVMWINGKETPGEVVEAVN